jgi:transposase
MEERLRFLDAVAAKDEAFSALCRRFGVSRKTGYNGLRAMKRQALKVLKTARVRLCVIRRR